MTPSEERERLVAVWIQKWEAVAAFDNASYRKAKKEWREAVNALAAFDARQKGAEDE